MSGCPCTGQLHKGTLEQGRRLCGRQLQPDTPCKSARCIADTALPCRNLLRLDDVEKLFVLPQVVEGKLSAGELSSFVIYALYVGSNVGSLASVISNLIQVSMSACSREWPVPNVDPSCPLSNVLKIFPGIAGHPASGLCMS